MGNPAETDHPQPAHVPSAPTQQGRLPRIEPPGMAVDPFSDAPVASRPELDDTPVAPAGTLPDEFMNQFGPQVAQQPQEAFPVRKPKDPPPEPEEPDEPLPDPFE